MNGSSFPEIQLFVGSPIQVTQGCTLWQTGSTLLGLDVYQAKPVQSFVSLSIICTKVHHIDFEKLLLTGCFPVILAKVLIFCYFPVFKYFNV